MGELGGGQGGRGGVRGPLLLHPLVLLEDPGGDNARALAEGDLLGVRGRGQKVDQLETSVPEAGVPPLQQPHLLLLPVEGAGEAELQLVQAEEGVRERSLLQRGGAASHHPEVDRLPGVVFWLLVQNLENRGRQVVRVTGEQELQAGDVIELEQTDVVANSQHAERGDVRQRRDEHIPRRIGPILFRVSTPEYKVYLYG